MIDGVVTVGHLTCQTTLPCDRVDVSARVGFHRCVAGSLTNIFFFRFSLLIVLLLLSYFFPIAFTELFMMSRLNEFSLVTIFHSLHFVSDLLCSASSISPTVPDFFSFHVIPFSATNFCVWIRELDCLVILAIKTHGSLKTYW